VFRLAVLIDAAGRVGRLGTVEQSLAAFIALFRDLSRLFPPRGAGGEIFTGQLWFVRIWFVRSFARSLVRSVASIGSAASTGKPRQRSLAEQLPSVAVATFCSPVPTIRPRLVLIAFLPDAVTR